MSEHPIILTADMVRATLAKTKTQHRLPIMPQPQIAGSYVTDGGELQWCEQTDLQRMVGPPPKWHTIKISFGGPGDFLWVKECWMPYDTDGLESATVSYRASYNPSASGSARDQGATRQFEVPHAVAQEFSQAIRLMEVYGEKWRPPATMDRWASRITRVVKRVWAERIQGISEANAIAEGLIVYEGCPLSPLYDHTDRDELGFDCPVKCFRDLWGARYARKGLGWDENPWVFACEFELTETEKARKP